MRTRVSLCLIVVLGSTFAGETNAQKVYESQHEILVEAIKKGHAEGQLKGPAADVFKRQFKSDGALMVSVDVISDYPNPECKRLNMDYLKKEVLTTQGPQDFKFGMKLNYCLDGKPPIYLEGKK